MQQVVREGMEGGALGLSVSRNKGHYDPQGVHIPALWADEKEIFALADVLRELGTGIIQSGGGRDAEMTDGLMARLSEATGRPVIYNNLGQSVRRPGDWQKHMARVDETAAQGIRAYPLCSPNTTTQTFNMSEHAGVPRLADLAPDPACLRTRRNCAPMPIPRCGRSCTRKWSSGRSRSPATRSRATGTTTSGSRRRSSRRTSG